MRIRITGRGLPKAQFAGQQGGDPDDAWIRKILEYESKKGLADATGHPRWGFNNANPTSIEEAQQLFRQNYLPKVQQYPLGLRERMADYIFNTGRNANDLLLYNAGKISLDDINSTKTFDNEWKKYAPEIEKMYSDPNFINNLDQSKLKVYQSTKKVNGSTNPAYAATWQPRTNMWGTYSAPANTSVNANPGATQNSFSNIPTTTVLLDGNNLISPNNPQYAELMKQSSAFLNNSREKFNTPNFGKIEALKKLAPKVPTLSFKPLDSSQAAASINPFSKSTASTPLFTPQPAVVINNQTASNTNNQTGSDRKWHSEWDDEGFDTDPASPLNQPAQPAPAAAAQPSKIAQAANWYSKNIGDPVEKAFQGMDRLVSWGNLGTQLVNGYKKKNDFDKFMRRQTSTDSLFPEVPDEMSGNRGDYVVSGSRFGEFRPDEYVVNKGMYTGQFLPRMAQYGGGVIPDALTMPVDEIPLSPALENPITTGEAYASSGNTNPTPVKSSGANPVAEQTWKEVSSQFQGVQNWGIWGDANHKKSVSDHNTGDALDIGILNADQGNQISQKLIKEAQDKNIKYIIWNKQIWNPSISNSWRPYSGKSPHTDHVHVSFNRGTTGVSDGDEVALSHNNPLNIHFGDFASKYGATQGSKDGGGFVGRFPDLNTGIQAGKDLLFGPNYSNLTISQARNQWVSGNPSTPNASTSDIVKNMGADKKLSDLTPAERDKLFKLFSKWEGNKAYNKIKGMNLFADGGTALPQYEAGREYELTEDQIKHILASGGEVEFL